MRAAIPRTAAGSVSNAVPFEKKATVVSCAKESRSERPDLHSSFTPKPKEPFNPGRAPPVSSTTPKRYFTRHRQRGRQTTIVYSSLHYCVGTPAPRNELLCGVEEGQTQLVWASMDTLTSPPPSPSRHRRPRVSKRVILAFFASTPTYPSARVLPAPSFALSRTDSRKRSGTAYRHVQEEKERAREEDTSINTILTLYYVLS